MKKSEIFDFVLDKVCEVCEVRKESIMGATRMQSVVDARILAVQYMRRIGLSNDEIAIIIMRKRAEDNTLCPDKAEVKKKAKNIDNLFKLYSERCLQSFSFCLMSKEVKEFCHMNYEQIFITGMKELPRK